MFGKLVFFLFVFVITETSAKNVEVRDVSAGRSIQIDYDRDSNLATLREKIHSRRFMPNGEWHFINIGSNKPVSKDTEQFIPVERFRGNANFLSIRAAGSSELNRLKICFKNPTESCQYRAIDEGISLNQLRSILNLRDDDCTQWRFFSSKGVLIYFKSSEDTLTVTNIIHENSNSIYIGNVYNIELKKIHVIQQLDETEILINPKVTLQWLRKVLSKEIHCGNSAWKGPAQSIITEDTNHKWRVIVRSKDTASVESRQRDVSADLLVGIENEKNSDVERYLYVNRIGGKYIDYSNTLSDKIEFVGMNCKRFVINRGQYIIEVYNKYPQDGRMQPLHMNHVRSVVMNRNLLWDNVLIAENGTSIGFRVTRNDDKTFLVEIGDHNGKQITHAVGHNQIEKSFSNDARDIVLRQNVIETAQDIRTNAQTIEIKLTSMKSFKVRKNRRRRSNGQHRIPQAGVNQAELVEGDYKDSNKVQYTVYDIVYNDDKEIFTFVIFNFRSRAIAEKLMSIQPFEPF